MFIACHRPTTAGKMSAVTAAESSPIGTGRLRSSSSSSSSSDGGGDAEKQCTSADELLALETASRSVALLVVRCGEKFSTGTGFRVGQRYLVTAKHVVGPVLTVNNELEADAVTATFLDKPASIEDLTFSFRRSVHLIHTPYGVGPDFDIAILEFEEKQNSSAAMLPPPLKVEVNLELGTNVHVIGYPCATNGSLPSKYVDPACKLVFPSTFRPWDAYPHLDYSEAKNWEDLYVFYDCWVLHGASGSPVLQYVDGNLAAVAVHVKGFPVDHYVNRKKECHSQEEANAFDEKKRKEYRIFEAGISLGAVHSVMANESGPIFYL